MTNLVEMGEENKRLKIILAKPRGFCAGVERAIDIVERAIEKYGKPIYVRHEIVHNKFVVEYLEKKGAVFVKETEEVPKNSVVIFSAHGVSKIVREKAKAEELHIIDATCPLVTKVHNQTIKYERLGYEIILVGHDGHPEVEGTSGQVASYVHIIEKIEDVEKLQVRNPDKIAYVTQTTLSMRDTKEIIEALKKKFTNIRGGDTNDICYATQNRQNAVSILSKAVDMLLVIGSVNSSNSNRLRDLGEQMNTVSYLISSTKDIKPEWFNNINKIGITAGASAPEILVNDIISYIDKNIRSVDISTQAGIEEKIHFYLPKELRDIKIESEII